MKCHKLLIGNVLLHFAYIWPDNVCYSNGDKITYRSNVVAPKADGFLTEQGCVQAPDPAL